jgi:dCTP deaminase
LDLTAEHPQDPERFWEEVRAERHGRLVLEPEEFYLLMSREEVRVPPDLAAEMTAYDPTAGEMRTHYAGFFDPGFGYLEADAGVGSRAVLEVRAHDVPFVVEDGQPICRLAFEEMLEKPEILYGDEIGSSYQRQEEMLSKFFLESRAPIVDQLPLASADDPSAAGSA